MSDLPQGRRLVKVEYWYDDDSHYRLTGENAGNFSKNMDATQLMAVRGYKFLPVQWKEVKSRPGRVSRRYYSPKDDQL